MPRELEALGGVGMEGSDLRLRELAERDLLRPIPEGEHVDGVARELRADEVAERQRDPLGGGEPVLAVQDHGVRDVQHQDGRARRAVLRLVHHEVGVVEVQGDFQPFALDGVLERGGDIEVEGVAELVRLRRGLGLDARIKVWRVVGARRG